MQLSERVKAIKPSPTLTITALAGRLKQEGQDIIALAAGEPDFDTPQHIKAAAIAAIDQGYTKYTPVEGIPALRKAVAEKFRRENGLSYEPSQVLVSVGGKQSFYNLVQAIINPGDEVVIPAPYWVSYLDIVLLAGGVPKVVPADLNKQFKITAEDLEKALSAKTRLLVLNSPSNPTGAVYSKRELEALGTVLRNWPDIIIASDDIYEHILLQDDEPFCNILNVCPDLYDRTIVLNGVSKAYAMTGWRIGYAAGPKMLIDAMASIQSQSTSNPTSISQYAALAALEGDQTCITPMVQAFRKRHAYLFEALNSIPGFRCLPSQGAFYSFPAVGEAMAQKGIANDVDFCSYLLKEAQVALVPGSAFGMDGYVRFSFATSLEVLQKAIERLRRLFLK
jgi:aspartate aminotransferase